MRVGNLELADGQTAYQLLGDGIAAGVGVAGGGGRGRSGRSGRRQRRPPGRMNRIGQRFNRRLAGRWNHGGRGRRSVVVGQIPAVLRRDESLHFGGQAAGVGRGYPQKGRRCAAGDVRQLAHLDEQRAEVAVVADDGDGGGIAGNQVGHGVGGDG